MLTTSDQNETESDHGGPNGNFNQNHMGQGKKYKSLS